MPDPQRDGRGGPPRGPLDPRLLRFAPALRAHLLVCLVAAGLTAVAVLTIAEAVGRRLPELLAGDASAAMSRIAGVISPIAAPAANPHGDGAPVAAQGSAADMAETERALRSALASLQRISGAA